MQKINQNLKTSENSTPIFYFLFSRFCFLILLSTFYFLLSISLVFAAKLNITSSVKDLGLNQQFQVDVMLNTEDEEINAIEGKVAFPGDLLELKEIRDGNSIVNFWIERPKAKFDNEIDFSGITPGGYMGAKGLIFSLIFQTKNEGGGVIEIYDAETLLNDGKGTPARLSISNFQFSISEQVPQVPITPIKDREPPESFKPMIAKDPEMFLGKYFLVFATQDKGSGIDHYEILESRNQKIENRNWEIGESPYVLKDQKLRSYIYVKAVDKAGNERIAVVEPRYPIKWYENYLIWGIITVAIVIIWLIRRIKKKIEFRI